MRELSKKRKIEILDKLLGDLKVSYNLKISSFVSWIVQQPQRFPELAIIVGRDESQGSIAIPKWDDRGAKIDSDEATSYRVKQISAVFHLRERIMGVLPQNAKMIDELWQQ